MGTLHHHAVGAGGVIRQARTPESTRPVPLPDPRSFVTGDYSASDSAGTAEDRSGDAPWPAGSRRIACDGLDPGTGPDTARTPINTALAAAARVDSADLPLPIPTEAVESAGVLSESANVGARSARATRPLADAEQLLERCAGVSRGGYRPIRYSSAN